eukprot:CAMPEP_0177240530 /NCGR_PEP_ID=MMETSP0367-20130122/47759_1 /TAXON_ID=447022 ORGANISM="Scrippsiella hangoei-like, Strain SHHI-4" /NCGR_SAMPLE_ID=MMETSP0367 /ASSEMBLY_ACC=CAM_ASM_000362 /LENGTH=89 /DNA_ID=CAMNT_0018691957 /DNA_START=509 /DNA_END=778 /DNA_ORIENTATION=+
MVSLLKIKRARPPLCSCGRTCASTHLRDKLLIDVVGALDDLAQFISSWSSWLSPSYLPLTSWSLQGHINLQVPIELARLFPHAHVELVR